MGSFLPSSAPAPMTSISFASDKQTHTHKHNLWDKVMSKEGQPCWDCLQPNHVDVEQIKNPLNNTRMTESAKHE